MKKILLTAITCLIIMTAGSMPAAAANPVYSEDLCIDPNKASASSSYTNRTADKVFNNSNSDEGWENDGSALPQWVCYDFEVPQKIQKYTLAPGSSPDLDLSFYMPGDWELQGSNDGSVWTTLHQVTAYEDWENNTAEEFYFDNSQSFRYYRIYVTKLRSINWGRWLCIGEIEMMEQLDNGEDDQLSDNTNLYILMAKEEKVNLTAYLINTSTQPNLQWASETAAVATVDHDGMVTALETGNTIITVRTADGRFIASCKIKVMDAELFPPANNELRLMIQLKTGETVRLEFEGEEDAVVNWTSADPAIASATTWLNQNRMGEITAVSEGITYISADDTTQSEIIYVSVEP